MRKRKGITLVALVITIIILLILAGIVLTLTIGQQGVLTRAQQAEKNYMVAQEDESKQLEKLLAYENLPENTKDTEAGTKVKIPEKWYSTTPVYVSTKDGSIVKEAVKTASVEAVAVGNGETVPVPAGFYYVGGNLSSGVVISDNPEDCNKYGGQANVPSGVTVQDGKFVDELKGNQFVFIPCDEGEYHKYNIWNERTQASGTLCDSIWDPITPVSESMQVAKYGGFYVGRFEAGIAVGMGEEEAGFNTNAIPQSKAGRIPWVSISWMNAKKNAESMYSSNSGVRSAMMTGAGFDTMLKVMVKKGAITEENTTNPDGWGNCAETTVDYVGRVRRHQGNFNIVEYYGDIKTETTTSGPNGTGITFTTGASEQCKRYNIYDIAGNAFEMTDEITIWASNAIHVNLRGGGGANHSGANAVNNVASRYSQHQTSDSVIDSAGYRVMLYMN